MSKLTEGDGDPSAASAEESRKSRLDALKARRREFATETPEVTIGSMSKKVAPHARDGFAFSAESDESVGVPRAQESRAGGAPLALMQKLGSGGEGPVSQQLQQAIRKNAAKVMQILSRTPPDASGHLEGTPFTLTGIAKLARLLQDRAADKTGPGTRIAAMALGFLQENDPGQLSVHGLSAARLRSLWERAEPFAPKPVKPAAPPAAIAPPRSPQPVRQPLAVRRDAPTRTASPVPASLSLGAGVERAHRSVRDRLIDSAVKIMASTPADRDGLVPGTRFSRAGLGRVVDLLKAKASAPDPKVAAVASEVLHQIAPDPGESDVVHGVSVRKLRMLAAKP